LFSIALLNTFLVISPATYHVIVFYKPKENISKKISRLDAFSGSFLLIWIKSYALGKTTFKLFINMVWSSRTKT